MEPRNIEGGMRRAHAVHIEERSLMSVTGVRDVDSFNEQAVRLLTDLGELCIEGSSLRITKLNLEDGQVLLEGEILAMEYAQPEEHGTLFSRLFG
ncbi:MAG: sporulation protein YabP [Eubacteriales bacterium]|nr:sporulation protein YabP [Eubacteriales bacterium]